MNKQTNMVQLDKVEYRGKEYFYRTITIFNDTDGEKTVNVADEELGTEIFTNNDEGNDTDNMFAGYLSIDEITLLNDKDFAKRVEEVIYDNEP